MAEDERFCVSLFVVVINVRNIEVLFSDDDSILVVITEILRTQLTTGCEIRCHNSVVSVHACVPAGNEATINLQTTYKELAQAACY